MPLEWGAPSIITENYAEFLDALKNLSRAEKENVRGGFGPRKEYSAETPAIVSPGWNDVLVLGPRQAITRDEWRAHFAEQRGGPDARLSPSTRVEIERRARARDRIENSPTPGWAREVGRALTAIDNVQDLLSTVAVVGRLVVKPFPAIHPIVGTPLLLLAGAAGLLNALGLIGMALSPLYGLLCAGPSEALAAGLVTGIRGRAMKQLLTGAGKTTRRARTVRRVNRTGRSWLPGPRGRLPALIEGAQVTKDLFGWGIAFGGLMGLVNDAAFGAEQAARGRPPQLRTPRDPSGYRDPLRALLSRYPDDALDDLRNAAGVYAWAPWLLAPDAPIDDVERQQILIAHYVASELLAPFARHAAMPGLIERALEDAWTPPAYTWSSTAAELGEGTGTIVADSNSWPDGGPPGRRGGGELLETMRGRADAYWDALDLIPGERRERIALEALTTRVMERAALTVLGDDEAVDWREETGSALAAGLVDSETYIDVVSNPDGVLAMAAQFEREREISGNVFRARAGWYALAAEHGVRAFPLRPAS